jgi:hypothetical protein
MAVGEATIHDITFLNVGNANLLPGAVVVLDVANSTGGPSVALPSGALAQPIGVVVEKTKLNPVDATVMAGQGIGIRTWGIAFCLTSGVVAIGDMVSIANTTGQVQTQARAGAGVQPVPIVGRALTASGGAGASVMVLLMIGSTY